MRVPDVLTMGEAMALLLAHQPGALEHASEFTRTSAGAELNVAIGLRRLGHAVAYVSSLGDDSLGRHLRNVMAAEGLALDHVRPDRDHPTGFMLKSMADDGSDPQVEYFRRGSAASHLSAQDMPDDVTLQARILHLTGITPALSPSCSALATLMAQRVRGAGGLVTFDPNLRPRLWPSEAAMVSGVNALAALADVVLPGLAEGRVLTGHARPEDIADFYLARGASQVVVKLGPDGAYFASAAERGLAAGVPVAAVVDTVGAGDGFAVGIISALLDGLPLAEAAARGNAIGARVVQFRGDSEGLPTRAALAH